MLCVWYQPAQSGSHRRNNIDYVGYQKIVEMQTERHEMKLSEELAKKLEEQIAFNNAMMIVNTNLLMQNNGLLNVVNEIKDKAVVKPEMDAKKKQELLQRLAEGKKRKAEEDAKRKKENAKKMAKVRKGK